MSLAFTHEGAIDQVKLFGKSDMLPPLAITLLPITHHPLAITLLPITYYPDKRTNVRLFGKSDMLPLNIVMILAYYHILAQFLWRLPFYLSCEQNSLNKG
ncbi:hypothetical protein BJP36_00260 [Moorena producens JHB]|uniref:Uncharacterized protein n=1 Tax=Moorena producens (strain JHB) TaxID=1454205 RepID=A0A1D9FT48_MOOP1|nr:hypothetical protein [Moorena producens]AOY78546.1 hypothetical protein BJP36_00260 [Moorena producens JHB]